MVLSPREAEVLAHVASHRTNAEIAGELFISVRTVETHVASLLRKLGATNRRELIALAGTASLEVRPPRSLVGREAAVSRLRELLDSPGLVTVVGPGGVGKTSLVRSLEGAVLVDLTALPVDSGEELTAATALTACGADGRVGRTAVETLASEVRRRQLVLVLDNCEHLLPGAAAVAAALVRTPGVRVVATSRERLGVPGERLLRLEVLDPDSALELFVRRASELDPPVTVGPEQRPQALAVCSGVEFLPLALELAAARLGQLALEDLLEAVTSGIDVLEGGDRVGGRHRSIRSMLDWSYGLLAPSEQRVHRWLSLVSGPFRVATATALLGEGRTVAPSIARLVDASLLTRVDGDRYRQLDPVRAHAVERLSAAGERSAAAVSLLEWAARALAAGGDIEDVSGLRSAAAVTGSVPHGESLELLRRLASFWLDREAWRDAVDTWERAANVSGDASDALAAAEVAWMRWHGDEAWRLFDLAVALAEGADDTVALVRALEGRLELAIRFPATLSRAPDLAALKELLHHAKSTDTRGHLPSESRVACAEALVRSATGDTVGARDSARKALAIAEAAQQPVLESAAWDALSAAAWQEGDAAVVHEVAVRRLMLRDRLGGSPRAEVERSDLETMAVDGALAVGRFGEARRQAEVLLNRQRARGLPHVGLGRLATCEFRLGEFDATLAHATEAVRAWETLGGGPAGYLLEPLGAGLAISGYRNRPDDEHDWLTLADRVSNRPGGAATSPLVRALRADVHLFHGRTELAEQQVTTSPWDVPGLHRSLYAAVRATVLGGEAVREAERLVAGNRFAEAIVARARGDLDTALSLFGGCGAAFEAARTRLAMAPGDDEALNALEAFLITAG